MLIQSGIVGFYLSCMQSNQPEAFSFQALLFSCTTGDAVKKTDRKYSGVTGDNEYKMISIHIPINIWRGIWRKEVKELRTAFIQMTAFCLANTVHKCFQLECFVFF